MSTEDGTSEFFFGKLLKTQYNCQLFSPSLGPSMNQVAAAALKHNFFSVESQKGNLPREIFFISLCWQLKTFNIKMFSILCLLHNWNHIFYSCWKRLISSKINAPVWFASGKSQCSFSGNGWWIDLAVNVPHWSSKLHRITTPLCTATLLPVYFWLFISSLTGLRGSELTPPPNEWR